MTSEEILALKPEKELNVLVAEKVMGWKECSIEGLRSKVAWGKPPEFDENDPRVRVEDYSTDISAAWEIVEKTRLVIIPQCGAPKEMSYCVRIEEGPFNIERNVFAETAPEAICKAALLAVMEGEE